MVPATHEDPREFPPFCYDLRQIAGKSGSEVLMTPTLGGRERRFGTISTQRENGPAWSPGLDWAPDGRCLAGSDTGAPEEQAGIFLISTEKGEKRRLTHPAEEGGARDKQSVYSPNGQTLAFVRSLGVSNSEIRPLPFGEHAGSVSIAGNGDEPETRLCFGMTVSSDRQSIFFSQAESPRTESDLMLVEPFRL